MSATGPSRRITVRSPDRAWRLAYARTLLMYRRSVSLHRPMSLPNVLRLYSRWVARCVPLATPDLQQAKQQGSARIRRLYGWTAKR